jgi:hypothetical protein
LSVGNIGSGSVMQPACGRDLLVNAIVAPVATKEIGDRNEIAWLYEVVDEQERGIHDNRNPIRKALPAIESEHNSTPELEALVQRARRAIDQ